MGKTIPAAELKKERETYGIYQTETVIIDEAGIRATVAVHAKDRPPPENAVVTVQGRSELEALANRVLAAQKRERNAAPAESSMLKRSREQMSTTAGG